MFKTHKSARPVKAYLLGELDEPSAEALEQKYFTDPAFFQWVGDVEQHLISDYLRNRLDAAEREKFEKRYLGNDELRRRVEQVRERGPARSVASIRLQWVVALTTIVIAIAAIALWQSQRASSSRNEIAMNTGPVLNVSLSPGLVKGDMRQVEFTPPQNGRVRLSFELPGATGGMTYEVRLMMVGDNGERQTVATASATGPLISAEIGSSVLRRGDYIAELSSTTVAVLETYTFRVNTP